MSNNFFVLKFYHINSYFSFEIFNISYILLIFKSRKKLFLKQKITNLLIKKNILKNITKNILVNFDKININTKIKII